MVVQFMIPTAPVLQCAAVLNAVAAAPPVPTLGACRRKYSARFALSLYPACPYCFAPSSTFQLNIYTLARARCMCVYLPFLLGYVPFLLGCVPLFSLGVSPFSPCLHIAVSDFT